MGINCSPTVEDLFLYSYETDFGIIHLLKSKFMKSKPSFYLTFRYIDDVLSLNSHKLNYYIDVIHREEFEIKVTTDGSKGELSRYSSGV